MEIDLIFKIAAIGIIVAVLNQLLIRSKHHTHIAPTPSGIITVCPSG